MRVLICGGRDFYDQKAVFDFLDAIDDAQGIGLVIEGGASGADKLAARWAYSRGVPNKCFPADWKTHGRAAGPIRNTRMIEEGKPDFVVAFPGGRGTANMVMQAEKAGIKVMRPMP